MRLLLFSLILLLPSTSSFEHQKKKNIVNFSVKYFNKSQSAHSVDILNKNWDPITEVVNFNPNGSKLTGRISLDESIDKVILKLGNRNIIQDEILFSLGNTGRNQLTIHTDSYKMKIFSSKQTVKREMIHIQSKDSNGCQCSHGNCACCLAISVPEFRHSVCANATYNPVSIGLDLSLGVDGHYFTEEVSLRNPPPICFSLPIPGAEHIAGVCVAFTKLDLDKKAKILSGCMDFEVELIHLRALSFHLGCFRMPI
ncbi:unnamed protein product [Caenorhabditis nigoni]